MKRALCVLTVLLGAVLWLSHGRAVPAQAPGTVRATGSGWAIQRITDAHALGPILSRNLCLDSAGQPHIAYAIDSEIYHAWRTEAGWQRERVPGASGAACLVLDRYDNPHVVAGSCYAYRDASGWHSETVEGMQAESLAVDDMGRVHVVYTSQCAASRQYLVCYALRQDGQWQSWIVDALLPSGHCP